MGATRVVGVWFLLALRCVAVGGERAVVLPANMKVLRCSLPEASDRFLGSSAPGQLFFPREAVKVRLALARTAEPLGIGIQEITTRDPERRILVPEGYTDTAGHAPLVGLAGRPIIHRLDVPFGDRPEVEIEVPDLPIPVRFGTYALILLRGKERRFLGTVARVPRPREDGTLGSTPLFGEAAFFDRSERFGDRAATYARMGVRGLRLELGWSERQDGNPYWGQCDWLCPPELYPRYGRWIRAFCQRYWKDGRGALWGIDNYNEPWEGGGISGWARDCLQYRALQKLIATNARAVDRRIRICAASSIMNTEEKLYSDGSPEFDRYLDVFTDHYVVPAMCYGPMVARAHGKVSVETETWFVNSEYLLPQVAQFLAAGQLRLSPWHPRVLFDRVPGVADRYHIPAPVVVATAVFNHFVTGKRFERVVFRTYLPWVFQFGKDDDPEALLVMFGQLAAIGRKGPRQRPWWQVDASPGGSITIHNDDQLLQFFDLAGNRVYQGQARVVLPMSIFPTYIRCARGPRAAAERLRDAVITGKRPVEILPRDFASRLAPAAILRVGLHNCLNRRIAGTIAIAPPPGLGFRATSREVTLAAGQTSEVAFEVTAATPSPTNAYPFAFAFKSEAGKAAWREVLNATIAPKGTKTIDGKLDDWADVPGVRVVAGAQEAELTELLRRPWLDLREAKPRGNFAEFKVAWDERFLYLAARVNDPTPQPDLSSFTRRDEDSFFHSAASDKREPYRTFLEKHPGRSFAEVPYVYCRSPEAFIPFRRDRLQIALDVTDDWEETM